MKLLVDACLTPQASGVGWGVGGGVGVEVVHVNHRNRRTDDDTSLFRYAQEQGMAIVTVNEKDFASRAAKFVPHHGVFFVPAGLTRAQQVTCIKGIRAFVVAENDAQRSLTNRLLWVDENGVATSEA
jgi:predicted nuclease of predicted toxin-antitoxin system